MAVYTQVSEAELQSFLSRYEIGDLVAKTAIAEGVENTNYKIETTTGAFILTLFEKRTDERDLPFFMALTDHLSQKNLPVPAPIVQKSGTFFSPLHDRPAVIIEYLPGKPEMDPQPLHCEQAGQVLAEMHLGVKELPLFRTNALSFAGWAKLFEACEERADECAPGLGASIKTTLDQISKEWPKDLPRGIVHTDMFPDNVLFDQNAISGVIDFYFAATDIFAFDLAVTVNAWCFSDDGTFKADNALALMESYQNIRPLSRAERDAFALLLQGSALRFLLTRLYDWLHPVDGAIVTVKDPLEFFDILMFHRDHFTPEKYGLIP